MADAAERKAAAKRLTRGQAKVRRVKPALPSILFEGDVPRPPSVSGPGQRYALGPTAVANQPELAEEIGELPEAYGTRRLFLAARDPHWLYAHWDFTTPQLRDCNARSADRHLVLRVFQDTRHQPPCAEVHVHPESRNWFVHVGRGGAKYLAELGYYRSEDHAWIVTSVSEATLTPPDTLATDAQVDFVTIPVEIPFEQLVGLVSRAAKENVPLAEALMQLRAAGYPGLPSPEEWPTISWTAEHQKTLTEVLNRSVSMDAVRRVWVGSLEITELVRRHLAGQVSSAGLPIQAVAAGVSSLRGVSSPSGGAAEEKRFWFNVNAELVIYGATEPDATVKVGGRRIQLRSDGTFSFRFALPDGQYELPAEATSADGTDHRSAALEFARFTAFSGEVGTHPQDPRLKPPEPSSIG